MFTQPDTAWIVLIVGVLGVYFELCSPGLVVPGVAGGVLAALSAASLIEMRPHVDGAVLLIFGMALLWIRGAARLAGTTALVWGAVRFVDGIHVATALATCVPFAAITVMLLSTALRARANKTSTAIPMR